MEDTNHKIELDDLMTLMVAGNFTFSVKSLKTNNHYTFEVKENPDDDIEWIVYHMGVVVGWLTFNKQLNFTPSKYSVIPTYLKAFIVTLNLAKENRTGLIELWGSGKCARCGRKLTTEESVILGIGPECKKLHNELITSLINQN